MALQVINWPELLDKKYPSYKVEVNAYLDSLHIASSNDISIEKIYQAIRNDADVNENLKALYHECLFGTDKNVKLRIKNRVANFRCALRGHPKVRQLDSMHATDMAKLDVDDLDCQLQANKSFDKSVAKSVEKEAEKRKQKCKGKNVPQEKVQDGAVNDMNDPEPFAKKSKVDFKEESGYEASCENEKDEDANLENDGAKVKYDDPTKKEQGGWQHYVDLESGDIIFSDHNDVDEDPDQDGGKFKDYGKKSKKMNRKKLLPKKNQGLFPNNDKKAEKEFDHIVMEDLLNQPDQDPPQKLSKKEVKDLVNSFEKGTEDEKRVLNTADEAVLQEIHKATKSVHKSSIEQTATLRAWGEMNKLDVDKHHKQVQNELEQEDNESGIKGSTDNGNQSPHKNKLNLYFSHDDDDQLVDSNLGPLYQNQEDNPNFDHFWWLNDDDE